MKWSKVGVSDEEVLCNQRDYTSNSFEIIPLIL